MMKRKLLFGILLGGATLFTTSCTKEYDCKCTGFTATATATDQDEALKLCNDAYSETELGSVVSGDCKAFLKTN